MSKYCKRLIEVDLPIRRISEHARREKYLGTITSLHLWWARRPLAACRAVLCATLWPDPSDPHCPQSFRDTAKAQMLSLAEGALGQCSPETYGRFTKYPRNPEKLDNNDELRWALFDFIADFANWDNSTKPQYLKISRALTQAAHEALGGELGARPLVVDPFAGGGSIPLEALRIGADAFASDLNPVPVLLNRVLLEHVPKYGQRLADEVRKWGEWVKQEAEKELSEFYPRDKDGAVPIAYLWARTVQCEGPGCGADVPLIRSLWLAKKGNNSAALRFVPRPRAKRIDIQIIARQRSEWVDQENPQSKIENPKFEGTVARGSATCPCCGFTTPVEKVRQQLSAVRGGANTATLLAVVTASADRKGRQFRLATPKDLQSIESASKRLQFKIQRHTGKLSLCPDEPTPIGGGSGAGRAFSQRNYGMNVFSDLFTSRQLLSLVTFTDWVHKAGDILRASDADFADSVQTILALAVSRESDHLNSGCTWNPSGPKMQHLYARQAIPIVWDFCEANPFGGSVGDWISTIECCISTIEAVNFKANHGTTVQAPAQAHPLPDDSAQVFATDPPYYDAVPYSDLSDFFHVWLKRTCPNYSDQVLTPKDEECIVDEIKGKDNAFFEKTMTAAMAEGRRILAPSGVGFLVFAHKSTAGWEAQLQAMIRAGWIITASWPIDTELATRLRARDSAALASSVHLVCRPRENSGGPFRQDEIGDWRDILGELPGRIRTWMQRLLAEGVVGADAIFACLGPALEIYSRYSRVEKADGEQVFLGEFLEHVWATVSREALATIFEGADASGFEPDARLTAMWLWTLNAGATDDADAEKSVENDSDDESSEAIKKPKTFGFVLEYDAARKIAQGLGANLELLGAVAEISGDKARLLSVAERTNYLFGKDETRVVGTRKKKEPQMDLFKMLQADDRAETTFGETKVERHGQTALDRIHQSMILFAAGRSEALKRFLVEDGIGRDPRFWRLAQALSALYPSSTDEKRWVDGVLARKKGLGF